ncbi:stage II sporulation protein R [uncultured Dysosmobacter sp.]|uniref:stage II sporulation protein R n=1 Tax=uncultured Dysosmobacter sp. TaxID=2591384 RepID=UPI0026153B01|nr:stage II sporulation protein R [uncultured Dysosmobacter sp.]
MKTAAKSANRLKVMEIVLLIGLAVFLASGALALRAQDALADKVVRLHVLANSDSEEDQALKLRVRDTVLERATELLREVADREEAEVLLQGRLLELERLAGETVAANGYDYPVTVELADAEFPTKEYDGFTLPAGRYLSLRVLIGEAAGQNWWCVVFPPLCTAASADVPASALAAGFSEEEIGLITEENEGYVLKFKAVEFWEELQRKWN